MSEHNNNQKQSESPLGDAEWFRQRIRKQTRDERAKILREYSVNRDGTVRFLDSETRVVPTSD